MKLTTFTFFITVAFFSCSKQHPKLDTVTIANKVKSMFLAYDDSVRTKGLNGEFFFLDHSNQFYWVPPGYRYAIQYDSIATILHQYAPHYKYINNSWDTLQIMVLSEQLASFNGVINSVVITTNNDTILTKFSETGLVIKRGQHWKFLSGQTVKLEHEH